MRLLIYRLAVIAAVAFAPVVVATVGTPAVSSAAPCVPNWSFNYGTGECKPPPPMPAWYHQPPPWAPPFAPPDVEPPPPPPPWGPTLTPVWDQRFGAWRYG